MALFVYKALDENSSTTEGTVSADSPRAARDLLRGRGLVVEEVTQQHEAQTRSWWPLRRRMRYASKRVEMLREMSTLLAAGIPLLETLDSLVQQHKGGFHDALLLLREQVAAGMSLADAMREQSEVFDTLSIHMVEVGENSGTLDDVLDQLANFSERSMQLKDRVTNALFYPIVVFVLSMCVGMFLMTVVVPMLLDNLLEAGRTIPWPTRMLKGMSDLIRTHGFSLAAIAGTLVVGGGFALRSATGRRYWHRLLLRLPVVGQMARKQEIARMALIISTLLESGIVLLQSLEIAARAMRNVVMRDAVETSYTAIQTGREIGEALEATGQFPPTVIQIFSVGQQSGKLEEMLARLADTYDRQVTTLSLRLATLMEPILIVGLAVFVGFILFATVLPILEAGNVL